MGVRDVLAVVVDAARWQDLAELLEVPAGAFLVFPVLGVLHADTAHGLSSRQGARPLTSTLRGTADVEDAAGYHPRMDQLILLIAAYALGGIIGLLVFCLIWYLIIKTAVVAALREVGVPELLRQRQQ